MRYDDGVRWKGIFAALLAVIFMITPSCAMFCDLACASATDRQQCPICGSHSHTGTVHMHCAHMHGMGDSSSAHLELTAYPSCAHNFCDLTSRASLPAKAFQIDQLTWTIDHPAARLENDLVAVNYVDTSPSPIVLDSNRPLTVALRI